MREAEAESVKPNSGAAWSELIGGDAAAPVDLAAAGSKIIATVDAANCPRCGSPAVKLGQQDRGCCGCGLSWTVVTERDELDAKADREVRSRAWNEESGRGRKIGRGASRW